MKGLNNRQNKIFQFKSSEQPHPQASSLSNKASQQAFDPHLSQPHGGIICGLLSNILAATRVAKAAKHHQFGVHNFDKSDALLKQMKEKRPSLVILDWDGCEAESFKFLNELRKSADLKGVGVIGFASGAKQALKEEAQRAGCQRVYSKTEFMNQLEDLVARWAK